MGFSYSSWNAAATYDSDPAGGLAAGRRVAMSDATGEAPGIHPAATTTWLRKQIPEIAPPLRFERMEGGHSNLTYCVTDAVGGRWVLRRPPLGAVLATAHDMAREHKIISGVGQSDVPVPRALGLCEDDSVNGAPFYVMSFVPGVVLSEAADVDAEIPRALRPNIGESVIEVLAALHRVDPDAVGLGDLGRKEAYLERQLKRWKTQWERSKTRELPPMDQVHRLLVRRVPPQRGASIVHGDYRLGNMLTGADGRIAAVLDWELCTLGDPLADLGYLLNNWCEAGETGPVQRGAALAPTAAGGFPGRDAMIGRYAEATGRDVGAIGYYRAFQYWRLAAIVEGVLARYVGGAMAGEADTEAFRDQVESLAEAALEFAETECSTG